MAGRPVESKMTMDGAAVSSRRDVLRGLAAGGAGALVGTSPGHAADNAGRGEPLRFAHLTDMHVMPERRAGEGFAAAMAHLATVRPAPSFIVTGGDHVMSAFETARDRANVQWEL